MKEMIFENFNISENNIINVKLAKVLTRVFTLEYLRVRDTLEQVERLNKHPKMQI
jgi:hypothetical protein